MKKFGRDELARRIDEVLFYVWDPIGVGPNPGARSEYSSYVPKILEMLEAGRDAYKIASYLIEIESGMLASSGNDERARRVANLLLANKEAIEEGLA